MVRQMGNCQKINCQSTHRISTIFWFQQQTATYMKKRTYFSVYGKQRGFFSGKICVILLPQACVCVCAHACVCLPHGYVQPVRIPQQHSLTHKLQKKFQDSLLSISRAPSSSGANHGSKPTLPMESSDIIWNIWHWCSQLKILCQKPTDWIFKTWRNTRELKELHAFSSRKKQRCYPWRSNSWSSCELYTVMIPTVIRFKMVHMYKILLQIVTIKFGWSLENSEDNVMVRCQPCGSKKLAMLQDSTW